MLPQIKSGMNQRKLRFLALLVSLLVTLCAFSSFNQAVFQLNSCYDRIVLHKFKRFYGLNSCLHIMYP